MVSNNVFLMAILVALMFALPGCMQSDRYAAELENPSLCNEKESESERLSCFRYVSMEKNKPELCEYYSGNKADCYTKVAIGMKDQSVCDRISNADGKYVCIASVTGDTAVENLLDLIEGKDEACVKACSGTQTQCFTKCTTSYAQAIQECTTEDTAEVIIGATEYCEKEAQDKKDECAAKCNAAAKTCADKC
jgi:hypothetical protein